MLVGTGGHLHPGGLWTDLWLERGGQKVRLFRSRAKYFEPAGAVSWDVAMEVTPAGLARRRQGAATCSRSARPTTPSGPPGTRRWGSCRSPSTRAAAGRTRSRPTSTSRGAGHPRPPAPRTATTAAPSAGWPTRASCWPGRCRGAARWRSTTSSTARGDLLRTGARRRPPAVRRGSSLKFVNRDADAGSCTRSPRAAPRATARRASPIRSPTGRSRSTPATSASGRRAGPPRRNARRGRRRRTCAPGPTRYFCRVHPFMRGAFRVRKR